MARARATPSQANDDGARVLVARPLGSVLEFMRSLWGVNHALESRSARMKAQHGISGPERMVVRIVGRYPGIAAGELARILRVHPSTMTWSLKRLVRRGLVTRESDAKDARRALFTLTAEGKVVDGLKQGTVEAAVRSALAATPAEDVRTAVAVLEQLIRSLE